ncbi:MAG: hypothetical protein ISP86_04645 [Shewanellaceae bacterium]|nr:hypothetical protein [Shewanellaceae bacterium]
MWLSKTKFVGANLVLEPIQAVHLAPLTSILKQHDFRHFFLFDAQKTSVERYLLSAIDNVKSGHLAYALRHRVTDQVIGYLALEQVDHTHQRIVFGDVWLSDPSATLWVLDAYQTLWQHYFVDKKAAVLEIRMPSFQQEVIALLKSLTLHLDGHLRQCKRDVHGDVYDMLIFSILRSEWSSMAQRITQHSAAVTLPTNLSIAC